MADFAPNLFASLTTPTIWVELPELPWRDPIAAVELAFDGETNSKLRNARTLRTLERGKDAQEQVEMVQALSARLKAAREAGGDAGVEAASGGINADALRATFALETMARDLDRELYPEFVVRGWRGVRDVHDVEVPYNLEDCRKVFAQLVGDAEFLLDRIRAAAKDAKRFPGYRAPGDLAVSLGNS